MTNIYHATPYDISASGFYFEDYEGYHAKARTHRNEYGEPVEEYEIQFIDGDNCKLFAALKVNQANLELWCERFAGLLGEDAIKALYLADDLHFTMENLLDNLDDVVLFEGSTEDYANQYLEDTGLLDQIPQSLQSYFDLKSFAHDMILNGEITELRVNNVDYIVWGR